MSDECYMCEQPIPNEDPNVCGDKFNNRYCFDCWLTQHMQKIEIKAREGNWK